MKYLSAIIFFIALAAKSSVFSIAQFGDLHTPANCNSNTMLAAQNFIITHTNDGVYNFVGVISPGDLYEQDTNFYNFPTGTATLAFETNWFITFQQNAMFTALYPGNHDADSLFTVNSNRMANAQTCNSYALLWTNIFTAGFFSNSPCFIGCATAGDSHQPMFEYVNSGVRLLIIGCRWTTNQVGGTTPVDPYSCWSNQIAWVTNMAASYPKDNIITLNHYFLDAYNQLDTNDLYIYHNIGIGPTAFTNGWTDWPNLMLFIGGHSVSELSGHNTLFGKDGHTIDVSSFNMQDFPDSSTYFRVWTFDTGKGNVTANTFSVTNLAYITNLDVTCSRWNGLVTPPNSQYVGQGYFMHNWTVPMAVPPQRTLLNFMIQ